ncbi:hypothetical protein LY78DRAFT_220491 [Colletotrichum sublineola]|nr:hypothetical protein LY78DRAFT_220491 [Colletotrichum sublineola]
MLMRFDRNPPRRKQAAHVGCSSLLTSYTPWPFTRWKMQQRNFSSPSPRAIKKWAKRQLPSRRNGGEGNARFASPSSSFFPSFFSFLFFIFMFLFF